MTQHPGICVIFALVAALSCAGSAAALQPVEVFLRAAKQRNHDVREVASVDVQRRAEVDVARGRLYPAFAAGGSYTRNQYEIALSLPASVSGMAAADSMAVERLVIQPYNQLDANLSISVPLFDLGAIERLRAAQVAAEVSLASRRATALDVENQVFRAYYQLLGQEAVLTAAKGALELARKNLALVQDKVSSGAASDLDVARARAEIARAEGDVAGVELGVVSARRQLSTVARVDPEPATAFFEDDLHVEAPLPVWLQRAAATPRVQLAAANEAAAVHSQAAAEGAFYPALSATAQERFTNATGFSGHSAVFQLQATLCWRFDLAASANVRAQNAALVASGVRRERAERAAQDGTFQAFHQVRAAIERARAARVQVGAARLAAELARDRYGVGAATQLDVIRAQEDAFRADVTRIQADTELAYARAALRASAGQLHEGDEP